MFSHLSQRFLDLWKYLFFYWLLCQRKSEITLVDTSLKTFFKVFSRFMKILNNGTCHISLKDYEVTIQSCVWFYKIFLTKRLVLFLICYLLCQNSSNRLLKLLTSTNVTSTDVRIWWTFWLGVFTNSPLMTE